MSMPPMGVARGVAPAHHGGGPNAGGGAPHHAGTCRCRHVPARLAAPAARRGRHRRRLSRRPPRRCAGVRLHDKYHCQMEQKGLQTSALHNDTPLLDKAEHCVLKTIIEQCRASRQLRALHALHSPETLKLCRMPRLALRDSQVSMCSRGRKAQEW